MEASQSNKDWAFWKILKWHKTWACCELVSIVLYWEIDEMEANRLSFIPWKASQCYWSRSSDFWNSEREGTQNILTIFIVGIVSVTVFGLSCFSICTKFGFSQFNVTVSACMNVELPCPYTQTGIPPVSDYHPTISSLCPSLTFVSIRVFFQ